MNKYFRFSLLALLFPFAANAQTCEHCGIGDVAPDAKLEVKACGTGTGKAFHITDSLNANLVAVLDNGKVGIGTASPGATLDVRE
ncbi:MAG: hypothetical protein ACKOXB_03420 [Flavobacteriales bacterium]